MNTEFLRDLHTLIQLRMQGSTMVQYTTACFWREATKLSERVTRLSDDGAEPEQRGPPSCGPFWSVSFGPSPSRPVWLYAVKLMALGDPSPTNYQLEGAKWARYLCGLKSCCWFWFFSISTLSKKLDLLLRWRPPARLSCDRGCCVAWPRCGRVP